MLLIPLASGLPAVHDYLSRLDESRTLPCSDLSDLALLVIQFVATSERLLDYAASLAGKPLQQLASCRKSACKRRKNALVA